MPSRRPSSPIAPIASILVLICGPSAFSQDVRGSWAFSYPSHPGSSRSLLDLRDLNEKEAGQSGFVRLSPDGNEFVLGDGTPARFWAIGSAVYLQPPDAVARHVRFLAKMGVNMVRLHTQVAPDKPGSRLTDFNENVIDHIWRFVAEAKKQGIYVTISPYWANVKDATNWAIPGYPGKTDLWGLLFFDETLQEGYRAWVRALYARKNPYTGIPLAADPAVAVIQVQNEDSLLFWTMQGLKPGQKARLEKKYADWLAKKYGSLDEAMKRWGGSKAAGDDLANGGVGMLQTWELLQKADAGRSNRIGDQLEFLGDTQRRFYAEIAAYYRNDLGCRQLINASNWRTADPVRQDDIERWTYAATDVIAVNKYFTGAHTGPNSGWRIDPKDFFSQVSALLNPRELPTNLKQVVGHPMIITESSWVAPLGYQSEGPFLIAAYESLTGVDAFYWFDANVPEYDLNPFFPYQKVDGQNPIFKWNVGTPAILGGFPASALLFRKGYVKKGEPVVHEERPLESLWRRDFPMIAESSSFDPNRDRGFGHGGTTPEAGVNPLAFLVGPVEVKYDADPKKSRVADLSRYIDTSKKTVKSITGELTLDYGHGRCTMDAPKAQGACGFLADAGTIALSTVSLKSKNPYAAVTVVAMDDQTLADSKRVLVQVVTIARPTGWQTRDAEFPGEDKKPVKGFQIMKTGQPPWRVTNTDVQMTVKNPGLTKATLLDPAGYAVKKVDVTRTAGGLTIILPADAMYVILE